MLAAKFAGKNELLTENTERFLLEVDRLKSCGQFSDTEILVGAYKKILEAAGSEKRPEGRPERNRDLTG